MPVGERKPVLKTILCGSYRMVLLEAKVGSVMLRISFRYYTKYQQKALAFLNGRIQKILWQKRIYEKKSFQN